VIDWREDLSGSSYPLGKEKELRYYTTYRFCRN
jgi:hypothetical protein